jgi:hypothetical protein
MKAIARVSLLAAVVALLGAPGSANAQHARQPVVPVDRGGTPTQPLPDPTGIYEGNVRFTVDDGSPVTQSWRVVLKSRSCVDCGPGQYWVTGTSFDGISYQGGGEERGSVDAMLDLDGTALDFRLATINCPFINTDIVAPPQTVLRGGSFGIQAGQPITVRNGRIDGSISGTDCFGRKIVGSMGLARTSSNPGSTCGVAAGWYQVTLNDSRGREVQGPFYFSTSNCAVAARISDAELNLEMLFSTASSGSISLSGLGGCDSQGSGNVSRQSSGVITGSYNGSILSGCSVNAGPVSATFTLDPI